MKYALAFMLIVVSTFFMASCAGDEALQETLQEETSQEEAQGGGTTYETAIEEWEAGADQAAAPPEKGDELSVCERELYATQDENAIAQWEAAGTEERERICAQLRTRPATQ